MDRDYLAHRDTDTHRICSSCKDLKPLNEFYKDGTTPNGDIKYRRDCKVCYKQTRIQTGKMKARNNNANRKTTKASSRR